MCIMACWSCSKSGSTTVQANKEETDSTTANLIVAVTPTMDCLAAYIAVERGITDSLGIKVKLKTYTSRMDQDTAIARSRVDGLFTDSVDVAYLRSKRGVGTTVCGHTDAYWLLIAGRTTRINRLEQLGDKIIGCDRDAATNWLSTKVLSRVKTKAEVYRVQVNDVRIRYNMLLVNAIDAVWLPEPYASSAIKHGHKQIYDSRKVSKQLGVIAFSDKAVNNKTKKKSIDDFLRCLEMAKDSIKIYGVDHYNDIIKNAMAVGEQK